MNWESLAGIVRHVLTFGGGFLVAKGFLDNETLNQAVAALVTLLGIGWSVWAKKKPAVTH
jgi:hypothetical protein